MASGQTPRLGEVRELLLVGLSSDCDRAVAMAEQLGGIACVDRRADKPLPFHALVAAATDDIEALASVAELGLYLVARRTIRDRTDAPAAGSGEMPGVAGLFPMIRHPNLTRAEADSYWRDGHAPLALKIHVGMTSYDQFGVLHRLAGPADSLSYDGFAFCRFDSMTDLHERFYDGPEGVKAIAEDVAKFADTKRSPRRLLATEYRF